MKEGILLQKKTFFENRCYIKHEMQVLPLFHNSASCDPF